MSKYTNISTEPVSFYEGPDGPYPVKPCMKSGFCCTTAPCAYGEFNEERTACKHLQAPNDIGQRDCGRYEWIKENVPGYEFYPAFGAGCCMPMFNAMREKVIENIKQAGL
jgi:hypothetical protein